MLGLLCCLWRLLDPLFCNISMIASNLSFNLVSIYVRASSLISFLSVTLVCFISSLKLSWFLVTTSLRVWTYFSNWFFNLVNMFLVWGGEYLVTVLSWMTISLELWYSYFCISTLQTNKKLYEVECQNQNINRRHDKN